MSSETLVQLQTTPAAKVGPTRFHLSLNVANLERAIGFFKAFFDREPARVVALIDRDPEMGTDRLSSAMLDFAPGQCVFTCSTQLVPFQRMQIFGTRGRIEIEIPYNIPPDRPSRIFIDDGSQLAGSSARVEEFPTADQYTIQGDAFSKAIQDDGEVPVTLENAVANMRVIEAVLRSGASGRWEQP